MKTLALVVAASCCTVAMAQTPAATVSHFGSGTTTEVGNAGILLDNSGPTATVHTTPAVAPVSTGIIKVDGTPAWCSVALNPPVIVQPGQAFFLQLDAFSRIAPPMHTAGNGSFAATVPNSPSVAGMVVFQQGAMVGAPNALGLFVTNAMRLRLGY